MGQGLLYLPDGIAMLILMAVLLYLGRQSRARDATLWLVGLSFILLEALASDAYRANIGLRPVSHLVALVMFVLAGFTFAWSALKDGKHAKTGLAFCITGSTPLLILCIVYGCDSTKSLVYEAIIAAGLLTQLVCVFVYLRGVGPVAMGAVASAAFWSPMIWFARLGQYRETIYWGLAILYLLVAIAMIGMIRRSTVGGSVVVVGFVTWAACLMSHPYIPNTTLMGKFIDQTWTMQKFVVTIGLLLVLLDEERRRNQELALNDSLTGLPNRRLLDDRLQQAIERSNRYRGSFALFVIDLDGFKAINDRLGHSQGDLVLREAARRLLTVVRSSDTLARTGGDEFVVVVNEIESCERCESLACVLRSALEKIDDSQSVGSVALSGSVGYALYPMHASDAKSLMMAADRKMYEQKAVAGRTSGIRRVAVSS